MSDSTWARCCAVLLIVIVGSLLLDEPAVAKPAFGVLVLWSIWALLK